MGAYARLVVLLLTAVMGLSPWSGTRELRREQASDTIEQQVSRPAGHSIAINRSEKHRGLHRQRITTPGADPVSGSGDDELGSLELAVVAQLQPVWAPPAPLSDGSVPRPRSSAGACSCRGPPTLA